jgi:hypothetical protein
MTTFTYADYVSTLSNLTTLDAGDPDFLQILPSAITYAENRIYREADLLNQVVRDTTGTLNANSRDFTLPSANGTFVVVRQINVITPVGTTPSSGGTRNPLSAESTDVLDMMWPSETAPSATTVPSQFAVLTSSATGVQSIIVGPPPGDNYGVEVVGTINPTPLSATNPTTYLTVYLWDLLIAASMVFMASYLKNFGAASDNPAQAMSWENQYKTLFASADLVDARSRFSSVSWSSAQPEAYAQPQRG